MSSSARSTAAMMSLALIRSYYIAHLELRIDRTEIGCRAHQDVVGAERQQRAGALGDVGDDNGELAAAGLRGTGKADCYLTISTWSP